jgi:hypothetical protein
MGTIPNLPTSSIALAIVMLIAFFGAVIFFGMTLAKNIVADMEENEDPAEYDLRDCTEIETEEDNVLFGGRL